MSVISSPFGNRAAGSPLAAGALFAVSRLRLALAVAGLAAGDDEKHHLAA
jgi:hypothetical protein